MRVGFGVAGWLKPASARLHHPPADRHLVDDIVVLTGSFRERGLCDLIALQPSQPRLCRKEGDAFDVEIDAEDEAEGRVGLALVPPLSIDPLIEEGEAFHHDRAHMGGIREEGIAANMRDHDGHQRVVSADAPELLHNPEKDLGAAAEMLQRMAELHFGGRGIGPGPRQLLEVVGQIRPEARFAIDIEPALQAIAAASQIELERFDANLQESEGLQKLSERR